jgi:hypothetical protein
MLSNTWRAGLTRLKFHAALTRRVAGNQVISSQKRKAPEVAGARPATGAAGDVGAGLAPVLDRGPVRIKFIRIDRCALH